LKRELAQEYYCRVALFLSASMNVSAPVIESSFDSRNSTFIILIIAFSVMIFFFVCIAMICRVIVRRDASRIQKAKERKKKVANLLAKRRDEEQRRIKAVEEDELSRTLALALVEKDMDESKFEEEELTEEEIRYNMEWHMGLTNYRTPSAVLMQPDVCRWETAHDTEPRSMYIPLDPARYRRPFNTPPASTMFSSPQMPSLSHNGEKVGEKVRHYVIPHMQLPILELKPPNRVDHKGKKPPLFVPRPQGKALPI